MTDAKSNAFPLVRCQAVANARNQWVALILHLPDAASDPGGRGAQLSALFTDSQAWEKLAPLDCIIALDDPGALDAVMLALLPSQRTIFHLSAAASANQDYQSAWRRLSVAGYRLLVDNAAGAAAARSGACGYSIDASAALPAPRSLLGLPGPHLARQVPDQDRLAACRVAGCHWFAGAYARHPMRGQRQDDGTSRKRLLGLLGLLARDADARELEQLLKQDPALAFQLLKLVNSAAFAPGSAVHSFGQAINLLGRRQLQRWLQLLLYAQQDEDGLANALLPLAALRGAHMESLSKLCGGDRDAQDLAFMTGVFSLLDVLLAMPMSDIVAALNLNHQVAQALLERSGPLGVMLTLAEQEMVTTEALAQAGIDAAAHWQCILDGYQWAMQVSRNL